MSHSSHRRRNAGLRTAFHQPRATSPQPVQVPGKLWPATNPDDAVTWWRAEIENPLFVYFIQDTRGPVKIGKARDPRARLAELQCGNPEPLTLCAVVAAAANTETRLHSAWDGYRIHGEWFGPDPRIIELAKRAQREQIDAQRRGKPEFDVLAIPVKAISPDIHVAARKLVSL